jgi:colicin import membrane protein
MNRSTPLGTGSLALLAGGGLALLLSACSGGSTAVSAPTAEAPSPSTLTESAAPATPSEREPADKKEEKSQDKDSPSGTMSLERANAIDTALSYLDYSAFSRSGLIDQLKYEGFSGSDAKFAVDSIDVDWSEQAAKSAASYLEYSAFSLSGLIDQLEYEGYTRAQAEYGANDAFGEQGRSNGNGGGGDSVSRQNAIESAYSYLEYSAFSRSGLIDQLEFEGYSTSDATYAVDSIDVNWNKQAAKSAASYLEYSSFSRSGLIDQLVYEGFTRSQAEYGVSQVGL